MGMGTGGAGESRLGLPEPRTCWLCSRTRLRKRVIWSASLQNERNKGGAGWPGVSDQCPPPRAGRHMLRATWCGFPVARNKQACRRAGGQKPKPAGAALRPLSCTHRHCMPRHLIASASSSSLHVRTCGRGAQGGSTQAARGQSLSTKGRHGQHAAAKPQTQASGQQQNRPLTCPRFSTHRIPVH